jgi:hypothetical protein
MIHEDFVGGFGACVILVVLFAFCYATGGRMAKSDIAKSCELTATFVVNGTVYNCEVNKP